MILRSKNPRIDEKTPVTWLSADYSSGTSLTVTSGTGFADNDIVVVGNPGDEKTELATINGTPTSTGIVVDSALSFSHAKETPVYLLRVNQISWEYKTTSTGTATVVSGMPINIRWDKTFTEYSYTAGSDTWYYRFRFYNSQIAAYTTYSDWQIGTGFGRSSGGYMLRTVKLMTKDPDGKRASDAQIYRWLSEGQDLIFAAHPRWWFWEKAGSFVTTASNQTYAITTNMGSDFLALVSLRYRYNPSASVDTTYALKYFSPVEFDFEVQDNTATDDDQVLYYTIRPPDTTDELGYLEIYPTPVSADKYLYYRERIKPTAINSSGDTTRVPLPSILENFAVDKIRSLAGEIKEADVLINLQNQITALKRINRRQVGQPLDIRYLGRKPMTRLFGKRVMTTADKENYW